MKEIREDFRLGFFRGGSESLEEESDELGGGDDGEGGWSRYLSSFPGSRLGGRGGVRGGAGRGNGIYLNFDKVWGDKFGVFDFLKGIILMSGW